MVDLVPGPVAAVPRLPDYQQELARCQRYAYVVDASTPLANNFFGSKFNTTLVSVNRFPPVVMRIPPTLSHNVTGYHTGSSSPATTTILLIDFGSAAVATLTGSLTLAATTSRDALNLALTAGTSWSGTAGHVFGLRIGPDVKLVFSARF
jgi:hypothetical protein